MPITKPTVGGSTDAWGTIVNTALDDLQAQADSNTATKAPTASPTFTGTVSGVTKTHVGLGNVDNTTDAGKPISTATQTALNAKSSIVGDGFIDRAVIPFGTDPDDVAAGDHGAHALTAYNTAGTIVTGTGMSIQGTGDANISWDAVNSRYAINVPTTSTGFVVKTADQSLSASSTTQQAITGITIGSSGSLLLAANTSRRIEVMVMYTADAVADFTVGYQGLPSDATVVGQLVGIAGPSGGSRTASLVSPTGFSTILNGQTGQATFSMTLLVLMGTTAGWFGLTAAQSTSDPSVPIVRAGSWLGWAIV